MHAFLRSILVLALALAAASGARAGAPEVALDRAALDALRGAAPGAEPRVLLRWTSANAARGAGEPLEIATTLRRIEVYAADARVLEATAEGYRELPRDERLHFVGTGVVGQRFGLSLDPDSGAAEGILLRDGKMFSLQGAADAGGLRLAARDMDAPLADGDVAVGSCSGNLTLDAPPGAPKAGSQSLGDGIAPVASTPTRRAISFAPKVATRQATVAVDTDNNFLSRKFSNNTTNATSYIAALFTALNAIYEDDPGQYGLQLRLVQGTVILRPSTTADPFANADTSATGAALSEFGGWWRINQVGVPRAFALLLSGNSSNQNGASGIAWLVTNGTYCTATGSGSQNFGHYSVNQVFWNPGLDAADDAYLVAHELGHNFGAGHTHCANSSTGAQASVNTIDRCFNGEAGSGCYSGPQSCPTGGESPVAPQGTLMSYCHLNGLNCGVSTEFHPTHVSQLNGRIASQPTSCITPLSTNQAPAITAPATFSAQEDTLLSLASISFADPDAGGSSLTATFSLPANAGAVNATPAAGVTVGGSAAARSLSGTLAALNAAMSAGSVSYLPAANASGSVNLTIGLVDGGAPQASDSEVRPINIAAVNDAPTLSLPGAPIGASEDVATAIAGVSFADIDAASGSLVATFSAAAGSFAATGTPVVTVGGTPTARTLTGTATNLNAYLATGLLTYTGAPNANGNVSIQVSLNDQGNSGSGGAQSANGTTSVQIAPVNDAPSVSAPASRSVPAGAAVAISPVAYADVDAPAGGIAVSASYAAASGTFSATAGGGVTVTGSGTGNLTLSGQLSAINAFVGSTPVQYTAAANAAGVVPVNLTINDLGNTGGGALAGTATVFVTVIAAGTIHLDGFED
jgi:hypothetical protein